MNQMRNYWLAALAGVLFATAASAQAPMSKPLKAQLKTAAVASTQEILDTQCEMIVLQLKEPLPQNVVFRLEDGCPGNQRMRCKTVCTKWIVDMCVAWSEYDCACR